MVAKIKNNISTKKISTSKTSKSKILTNKQLNGEQDFPYFCNEHDRLKYMKEKYGEMPLDKAFSVYYNEKLTSEQKKMFKSVSNVVILEVGKIVEATVIKMDKNGIEFTIPGVKEEIISKENLTDVEEALSVYLLKHHNKLSVEVREFKHGTWRVSVLNAYYRIWRNAIETAIKNEDGISVHVNSLTKGGYICSTPIWTLQELTGKEYESTVFVPGSQIVLNVETDFEQWVDQDIVVVPQNFGKFRKASGAPLEDSIVASRKRCLQKIGITNLYDMYQHHLLANKFNGEDGQSMTFEAKVTGIINSNNKTGIFVEIEDKSVVGMIPVSSDELLDYMPGQNVKVELEKFEVAEDKEPFVIKNNKIVKCYTKPIFKIA